MYAYTHKYMYIYPHPHTHPPPHTHTHTHTSASARAKATHLMRLPRDGQVADAQHSEPLHLLVLVVYKGNDARGGVGSAVLYSG